MNVFTSTVECMDHDYPAQYVEPNLGLGLGQWPARTPATMIKKQNKICIGNAIDLWNKERRKKFMTHEQFAFMLLHLLQSLDACPKENSTSSSLEKSVSLGGKQGQPRSEKSILNPEIVHALCSQPIIIPGVLVPVYNVPHYPPVMPGATINNANFPLRLSFSFNKGEQPESLHSPLSPLHSQPVTLGIGTDSGHLAKSRIIEGEQPMSLDSPLNRMNSGGFEKSVSLQPVLSKVKEEGNPGSLDSPSSSPHSQLVKSDVRTSCGDLEKSVSLPVSKSNKGRPRSLNSRVNPPFKSVPPCQPVISRVTTMKTYSRERHKGKLLATEKRLANIPQRSDTMHRHSKEETTSYIISQGSSQVLQQSFPLNSQIDLPDTFILGV